MRILIADDEPDFAHIIADVLGEAGHVVSVAMDGAEALRLLKQQPTDVVLLDLMMPHLDGAGALARVRQSPQLSTTKVIMMSPIRIDDPRLVADVDGWLLKPFTIDHLHQALGVCA